MTLFAVIKPDNTILDFRHNLDPNAGTKPGYKILPVIDTKPTYDDATQISTGPVVKVNANDVTRVWTVRAMTAQELAARDESRRVAAMERIDLDFEIIKALGSILFDVVNDVRVLKGQGTITAAQFKAAVKAKL